jgi:glycosyltransferase involved in cell wall biosynthesis
MRFKGNQLTGSIADIVVLAWTKISARQEDLAHQLSGRVEIVYPDQRSSKNSVARYLLSAKQTIRFLRRGSYEVLIVTAPPVEAALVCAIFRRRATPFLLDSHPGAFGLSGDAHSAKLQAVHRWLWRQAACVLVTTPSLAKTVQAGGGQALVFHEPPARWQEDKQSLISEDGRASAGSRRICVPFIFARDEPVDVLLAAAMHLPDVEFRVTGNPERLPKKIEIPPNLTLVGFLDSTRFLKELSDSDVVLVLSTEPHSVMRTAYEAIRLGRPLVVSKTEATRKYFPYALHTENSGLAVSNAIRALLEEETGASLRRIKAATEASQRITEDQMEELRARILRAS